MNPENNENIKRILAVDDSTTNILLLEGLLRDEGYEVETASSVTDAMQIINRQPPDLIILDLMMPRVSGFHLLRKVKSSQFTKQIPIFILSAKTDRKSIHMAKDLGADDYFVKPVDITTFLHRIKESV